MRFEQAAPQVPDSVTSARSESLAWVGQYEHAGTLGELVVQADEASVAQELGGIPASNTAVFNVLQDHGIVQPTPDGKAIWKATITSDVGWSHTFTLLRLAPSVIWESDMRPPPFAGTVTVVQDEEDPATPVPLPAVADSDTSEPFPAPPGGGGVKAVLDLLGTPDIASADLSSTTEALPPTLEELSVESRESRALVDSMAPAPPSTPRLAETPSDEHFIAWLCQRQGNRTFMS